MNIIIDPKYGNTISSEEFGYTFFLKSDYSTKYKKIQYNINKQGYKYECKKT